MNKIARGELLRFGIIGVTGYGDHHVEQLLDLEQDGKINFSCFTEISNDHTAASVDSLKQLGKIHYTNFHSMLEQPLDAVIIATPIHMHKEMALACFAKGCHVYLEKPPVVLLDDLDLLLTKQKSAGVSCQVGFQHASCESIHTIIEMVRSGQLGKVNRISAIGKWTRTDTYYKDSGWKGQLSLGEDVPVLDGSVMNPLSHLLNISLYVAEGIGLGEIREVRAELYRGHHFIKSEDTCCARIRFGSAELGFYSTTCSHREMRPFIRIQCDRGAVYWDYHTWYTRLSEGTMTGPYPTHTGSLLENFVRHLEKGEPLLMPLVRSRSFLLAANSIFASAGTIRSVPDTFVYHEQTAGGLISSIYAMEEFIEEASYESKLFSEINVPWAVPTEPVDPTKLEWDWRNIK